jgi:DNA-binding transcriptional regulator YiaG
MTQCRHGHDYTPANTYIAPGNGSKQCKACRAMARAGRGAIHSTPAAPLTPAQVRRLRDARADGVTSGELARRFGVSASDVAELCR